MGGLHDSNWVLAEPAQGGQEAAERCQGLASRSLPNLRNFPLNHGMESAMHLNRPFLRLFIAAIVTCGVQVLACPLCSAPQQTWTEVLQESDVVAMGRLVSKTESTLTTPPSATIQLVRFLKGESLKEFAPSESNTDPRTITYHDFVDGQPGDTILLSGSYKEQPPEPVNETFATNEEGELLQPANSIRPVSAQVVVTELDSSKELPKRLTWDYVEPGNEETWKYLQQLPSTDKPTVERLAFFLKRLEHANPLIAEDAWGEFAMAPFDDIRQLSDQMSRAKLREWLSDEKVLSDRLNLYGLMLGMCGEQQDIDFLIELLGDPSELRFGIEGLMGGILLLDAETGFDVMRKRVNHKQAQHNDWMAVLTTLDFFEQHGGDDVSRQMLADVARPMLKFGQIQGQALVSLARWNDWQSVDQLNAIYEASQGVDDFSTRNCITFAIVCRDSESATADQKTAATEFLNRARKAYRTLVRRMEAMHGE